MLLILVLSLSNFVGGNKAAAKLCTCQLACSPVSHLTQCRVGFGAESPDLAAMILKYGRYIPLPTWDMWSVGLLFMEVLGGRRPQDHITLLLDPVYAAEAQKGLRDPVGLPGQSQLMQYLASHVAEQTSYSDKVCRCTNAMFL